MVDHLADEPGWFAALTPEEQESYRARLWAEGRLKVEPWLEDRLPADRVRIRPRTRLVACDETGDGLRIGLDDGSTVEVDEVLLATGYQPHVDDLAFLRSGDLPPLAHEDGVPVLDDGFQTSVPGLHITSLPATAHFGPFFGFTIAVRMSASVITDAVLAGRAGASAATAG